MPAPLHLLTAAGEVYPPLISVEQAAGLLLISRSVAYDWAAAGHLPGVRSYGGARRVVTAELLAELGVPFEWVAA